MTLFEFQIFGITLQPSFYGLMYSLGFLGGYYILLKRKFLSENELDTLLIYIFFGVVLGGRIGYVIFYNLPYYLDTPGEILQFWKGGMSFHGGVLGVIGCLFLYAKKYQKSFLKITDGVTSILPIGIGLGRIGNYMNNELYGFAGYTGPFAMKVQGVSHFPSPLVEAFGEGLLLYGVLWYFRKRNLQPGVLSCIFLIGYSIVRISVELFFRLPDQNIGYIFGGLTLGMLLTLPMLLVGIGLLYKFQYGNNK